ncbi:MAG: AAA family ATPase [bacterium]
MKEIPSHYYKIKHSGKLDEYELGAERTLEKLSLINLFVGANNTGKSRFLRALFNMQFEFTMNNYDTGIFNGFLENIKNDFSKASFNNKVMIDNAITLGSDYLNNFINNITYKTPFFPPHHKGNYKELESLMGKMLKAGGWNEETSKIFIEDSHKFAKEKLERLRELKYNPDTINEKKRFYIPVLRGMRPLTEDLNADLYEKRTHSDYFPKENPLNNVLGNAKIFFSGLTLYNILKSNLLGKQQSRNSVHDFEEFLSKNFFNSKPITLIPREGADVVYVGIGNDEELPIHNLGDGLQNLIIITFNMFMEKEKCLFFIEEPELYMHPGFQRIFIEVLSSPLLNHHQYFITTHSNHLLGMTLDFENMSVFLFRKKGEGKEAKFLINQVSSRERNTLKELGVQNSSVFLSNSTIWVEGITDRLYLRKYMDKFKEEMGSGDKEYFEKINNFKEDYHYSFVEYQGANITHWSFDGKEEDKINAKAMCAQCFLIADGDIENKGTRKEDLEAVLGDRFEILKCKEIENLIPEEVIKKLVLKQASFFKRDLKLIGSHGKSLFSLYSSI